MSVIMLKNFQRHLVTNVFMRASLSDGIYEGYKCKWQNVYISHFYSESFCPFPDINVLNDTEITILVQ